MNDFWAEDFGVATIRTPVAILKEQASLLGKKTQNLVVGEVVSSSQYNSLNESVISHRFNIKAPALGDYSYMLFAISHGVDLYPLKISAIDGVIREDIGKEIFNRVMMPNISAIKSEDEFLTILAVILKSDRTTQIVRALLAQSLENGGNEVTVETQDEV